MSSVTDATWIQNLVIRWKQHWKKGENQSYLLLSLLGGFCNKCFFLPGIAFSRTVDGKNSVTFCLPFLMWSAPLGNTACCLGSDAGCHHRQQQAGVIGEHTTTHSIRFPPELFRRGRRLSLLGFHSFKMLVHFPGLLPCLFFHPA